MCPIFDLRLSYPLIFNTTRTAAINCESARATLSPRMIRGIKFLFADSVSVTAVRALGCIRTGSRMKTYETPPCAYVRWCGPAQFGAGPPLHSPALSCCSPALSCCSPALSCSSSVKGKLSRKNQMAVKFLIMDIARTGLHQGNGHCPYGIAAGKWTLPGREAVNLNQQ